MNKRIYKWIYANGSNLIWTRAEVKKRIKKGYLLFDGNTDMEQKIRFRNKFPAWSSMLNQTESNLICFSQFGRITKDLEGKSIAALWILLQWKKITTKMLMLLKNPIKNGLKFDSWEENQKNEREWSKITHRDWEIQILILFTPKINQGEKNIHGVSKSIRK